MALSLIMTYTKNITVFATFASMFYVTEMASYKILNYVFTDKMLMTGDVPLLVFPWVLICFPISCYFANETNNLINYAIGADKIDWDVL
jgi:hypothetical protein